MPVKRIRRKRPNLAYRLLIYAFMIGGYFGILRVGVTVKNWALLSEQVPFPPPIYFALGGTIWAVLCIASAFGLMAHKRWAPYLAITTVLLLTSAWWIEKLLLKNAETQFNNLPFALGLSILAIFYTLTTLIATQQQQGWQQDS